MILWSIVLFPPRKNRRMWAATRAWQYLQNTAMQFKRGETILQKQKQNASAWQHILGCLHGTRETINSIIVVWYVPTYFKNKFKKSLHMANECQTKFIVIVYKFADNIIVVANFYRERWHREQPSPWGDHTAGKQEKTLFRMMLKEDYPSTLKSLHTSSAMSRRQRPLNYAASVAAFAMSAWTQVAKRSLKTELVLCRIVNVSKVMNIIYKLCYCILKYSNRTLI